MFEEDVATGLIWVDADACHSGDGTRDGIFTELESSDATCSAAYLKTAVKGASSRIEMLGEQGLRLEAAARVAGEHNFEGYFVRHV